MKTMQIKAYEVFIKSEWYEDGAFVLIGVADENHPYDCYWDSYADERIYFYLNAEEMANLKVGDVLNDGEDFKIIKIDKDNFSIYEVEYDEKEYEDA